MLPNLSGLNLGCATGAKWGAGVEDYESLMDEPVYDSNGVQVNRGLPDDQLGKISKALELLQRVVDLPQTETFPTIEEMYARKIYDLYDNEWGRGWEPTRQPGKLYEPPIEYPDAWRDFADYMGFSGFTDPKGMEDVNGRPWSTKVKERRKRAFLSWGTSNPDEGILVPPTDELMRGGKPWAPWRFPHGNRDPWMRGNIDAFMYSDRNSSKKRRRDLIALFVEAVVYDSSRGQETPPESVFNPHGKSWSSIAKRIIDWITIGEDSLTPKPVGGDGDVEYEMWVDYLKYNPPYPFGSPIVFHFMLDRENAPESYAFMPDDFKVDPGNYFPFAMRGVKEAAELTMTSILTYVHIPTIYEMREDPAHQSIVRYTGNTPGDTPEEFVTYLKGIEAFANDIADKTDSPAVREMHQQLLEWLLSPDRPLGRQTLEAARENFETTEMQRALEAVRVNLKRQSTRPLGTVTKRRRDTQARAFASMIAFHGKAAVQRWRIAEHVFVV